LAPHVSPDDALLSRLTRVGIRATWTELTRLLEEGRDWRATGVLERRPDGDTRVPTGWSDSGPNESWPANAGQLAALGLSSDAPALWHARAAWVRPHRLIAAWLRQPGVEFRGGCKVERLTRDANGWQLFDPAGQLRIDVDRVVIAAGFESGRFAPGLPLQPVRGQVAWGHMTDGLELPATPLNGDGHLVAHVPDAEGAGEVTAARFTGAQLNYTVRIADLSLRVTVTAGDGAALLPVGQRVSVTAAERLHALKCAGEDPGHGARP
ncbi:FAD-dependent oxidoreductase, partial [Variovorax sp. RHLX14]|uniref:FAD-dependent oxidoreductase n=1 Tax=Variovorax sp. RHLX14 TaxID=1259731 RepID=UPI003F474339